MGYGRPTPMGGPNCGGGGGGGFENPMIALGDIIVGGADGTPERLGQPGDGVYNATFASGVQSWTAAAPNLLTVLTASGDYLYRTAGGALAASHQGTQALPAYAVDWQAADRFTKTLAGGDTFTHSNTEAKAGIRLVLTVNGQDIPTGVGSPVQGTMAWNSGWTTATIFLAKDGAGGYEYTLLGA